MTVNDLPAGVMVFIDANCRRTVGRRLDALGPALRLDEAKQARVEHLLAAKASRPLTAAERRKLRALLTGERRDLAQTHERVG